MIYHGDCLEVLKTFEADSIDALVTDPPAGISFMGKEWDSSSAFIRRMTDIFDECIRVMRPGAHGFVWALPRTSHWTATALEDAGFEIRDVVIHLFGSGFPKSMDISKAIDKQAGAEREVIGESQWANRTPNGCTGLRGNDFSKNNQITAPNTIEANQWQGWGTALKPASEHWILVRKPISEKTVAANVKKHRTGGINIDASRIGYQSDRTHDQGRFPSNLILDEIAAQMLDEQSGESRSPIKSTLAAPKKQGVFVSGHKNRGTIEHGDSGGASRFFYCAKTSKSERNAGCEELPEKDSSKMDGGEFHGSSTSKNRVSNNNHPTVKPKKLMSYLINMICPPGGICLDPFMGSGSTGIACGENGFQFIGIEKELEYFNIAEKRIKYTQESCQKGQLSL